MVCAKFMADLSSCDWTCNDGGTDPEKRRIRLKYCMQVQSGDYTCTILFCQAELPSLLNLGFKKAQPFQNLPDLI